MATVLPVHGVGPILLRLPVLAPSQAAAAALHVLRPACAVDSCEAFMIRWGRSVAQGGGAATRERSGTDPAFSWPARHLGCLDAAAAVRLAPLPIRDLKKQVFFCLINAETA